jgi:hypothetical protein
MTMPAEKPIMYVANEGIPVLNEPIPGGFYIKARKIDESEIAHSAPCVREVWDWLIRQCNHKDNIALGIRRGQCVRKISDIQDGLHWYIGYRKMTYSKSQCEHALEYLRKKRMIETTKTTRGLIITVCNYDSYQRIENYEYNNEGNKKPTRTKQQAATINKNDNNVNNDKELVGASAPASPISFKKWNEKDFIEEIAKYKDQYDRDTLNAFYKHWSEKNEKGKMLFQFKQTWETGKRLATWLNKEYQFGKK